jgi:hypothetical protein
MSSSRQLVHSTCKAYLDRDSGQDHFRHRVRLSKIQTFFFLAEHVTLAFIYRDDETFQPDLQESSPIWSYMQCLGAHGDPKQIPPYIKKAVKSKSPDLNKVGEEFAKGALADRYLIETSKAVTVIVGGNKVSLAKVQVQNEC